MKLKELRRTPMPNEQGLSKRQQLRERRQRQQMMGRLMTIGGIVVVVVVLFVLIILPLMKPVDVVKATSLTRPNVDFNGAGDPNAPITITEYSDYQCPYCRIFSEETEPQLIDAYVSTGKVYFVYRTLGLFIGAESQAAGEAAYCAGDQNKFWEYHDILFANQTGENVGAFNSRKLDAFAQSIGLDMDAFNACMNSSKYADLVKQDGVDGLAAGISATPSFVLSYVVNGETKTRIIQGAESFTTFQNEIESALAEIAAAQ